MIANLKQIFKHLFNQEATHAFFAPGRVNLIGEHTDYNGGYVFPCAIDLGTYVLVKKRDDHEFHIYSDNFPEEAVHILKTPKFMFEGQSQWLSYAQAVFKAFLDHGHSFSHGLNIAISGNLPAGAGLSSSASLELALAITINHIYALGMPNTELAKLSQYAENVHVGVHCGIMDQFASAMGKQEHALLLNTKTLDFKQIRLHFKGHELIIMNTNKKRTLFDSKYNERRSECEEALRLLNDDRTLTHLCDLSASAFFAKKDSIDDELIYNRARHVITENERVLTAVEAMKNDDLNAFASCLNQSHASLKNDYDVTGIELDTLVSEALKHGAIGARMTGAGFGGCAIALVLKNYAETMMINVCNAYVDKMGYTPSFYRVNTSDGAHEIKDLDLSKY